MFSKRVNKNRLLLAYVVGLALGDGNLSNPNKRVVRLRISCDTKYPLLIRKIKSVIAELLPDNKVQIVLRKGNCADVSCYSNKWPELLGWKVGNKIIQKAKIPDWVLKEKNLSIECLRGLIETDGSIYSDRGYISVMFVSASEILAKETYEIIKNLDFFPKFYRTNSIGKNIAYHVRLTKNVKEFLKLVKPQKK